MLGRIWKAGEGHKRKLVVLSAQLEHAMASPLMYHIVLQLQLGEKNEPPKLTSNYQNMTIT